MKETFFAHLSQLPLTIGPVAFSVFGFPISWYAISYLIGFLTFLWLMRIRFLKKEKGSELFKNWNEFVDFALLFFLSVIFAGRLGYIIFYSPSGAWLNLGSFFSLHDSAGQYIGVRGMSFFGALLGGILFCLIFVWKRKVSFWTLGDFLAPAIPAGYFWGRIGNFLGGELYGKPTNLPWGMVFPADKVITRHPSQLYEAFFEGILLFIIVWSFRNKLGNGQLALLWLGGYAFARFLSEIWRAQSLVDMVGSFSKGQVFSAGLFCASFATFLILRKQKR